MFIVTFALILLGDRWMAWFLIDMCKLCHLDCGLDVRRSLQEEGEAHLAGCQCWLHSLSSHNSLYTGKIYHRAKGVDRW